MSDEKDLSVEERICRLLEHLRIERAHVAASVPNDWTGLIQKHPGLVSSLTLIGPTAVNPGIAEKLTNRLLIVSGDHGPTADNVREVMSQLPDARLVSLKDYSVLMWSDLMADRTKEIGDAMIGFLVDIDRPGTKTTPPIETGEFAGISYRIQGQGPPLVLMPQFLAPSQWGPLVPQLAEHFQTITLGGAHLGSVAILEERGRARGYLQMISTMVEAIGVHSSESVLEVGCGTGVLARWLSRRTDGAIKITGLDLNSYLLSEAAAFVNSDGLSETIELREGNAEALPFLDESFDGAFSVTVIEECDANKMLAEMVRVTKPGGKIAVIARATDVQFVWNVTLPEELKGKVQQAGGQIASDGCADASLYRRFQAVGLSQVQMYPQYATFNVSEPGLLSLMESNYLLPKLTEDEARMWHAAKSAAEEEGTFFMAWPHHCAVGTKL